MIDISTVKNEHLCLLSGMFLDATSLFGDQWNNKHKKIRRWLVKNHKDSIEEFPSDIVALFTPEADIETLFAFLKACNEYLTAHFKDLLGFTQKLTEAFPEEVHTALWQLTTADHLSIHQNKSVEILVDDTPAYRRTLILKDGQCSTPLSSERDYLFEAIAWDPAQNRYRLSFADIACDCMLAVTFSQAEVRVEVFNATQYITNVRDPWELLCDILSSLCDKAKLSGQYCNAAEQALLPLAKEVIALSPRPRYLPSPEKICVFPLFKALAAQHRQTKITSLLTQLEGVTYTSGRYEILLTKIREHLCKSSCEPLWRNIFAKVQASQVEYPIAASSAIPEEQLSETRATVQQLMERHGYTGTYPDFEKRNCLRGLHLVQSYDMLYFVCNERRTLHRVRCFEAIDDDDFCIHFLCGTALLRKQDDPGDIFSCLFNANGRQLFQQTKHDSARDNIEQSVSVAVKKAELRRLTKQERDRYNAAPSPRPLLALFFFIFLFGGFFFGLLFTGIMALFTAFIESLSGGNMLALFAEFPWLYCFAASGSLFGFFMALAMVILVLFARKK